MFDIVALGETLIDFTPDGKNTQGSQLYAQNPGGAPANVLAMYAKLGGRAAFIGKVGMDAFGSFLEGMMQAAHIDTSALQKTEDAPTTLAFVHLDAHGERSFSFYRHPGADLCLTYDEVPEHLLAECRVFHFGSVSMTDEPCRTATLRAAQRAHEYGSLISFDPNYRPALWNNLEEAVRLMLRGVSCADVLKVSLEEMTLLTGETCAESGAQKLLNQGPVLVLVTDGEKGAYFATKSCTGAAHAYDVSVVDTTGAGDAFLGAMLYRLQGVRREELSALPKEQLLDMLKYANAAGGCTAKKRGAIPAMPTQTEIESCMRETPCRKIIMG